MPITEKKKKTDMEWKKKNKKTVTCMLFRDDAAAFEAYCAARGKSVNETLKEFIASCLGRPLERREGPRKKEDPPVADNWAEDLPE